MKFLALLLMTSFLLAVSGKSKYLTDECDEGSEKYKECRRNDECDEGSDTYKECDENSKRDCLTVAKDYLKKEDTSYAKCKCEKSLVKCVSRGSNVRKSILEDEDGNRLTANDYKNTVSTRFCYNVYASCLPKVGTDEVSLEATESIDEEKSDVCGYDYDYDHCKRAPCLTDNSPYGNRLSTNGKHWYQKYDKTYRVGDKCYKALTRCLGCLRSPSHYPHHLELVPNCITAACPKRPKPCHGMKIDDKCCERKNLAIEKTNLGHTFMNYFGKVNVKCCEHGAEDGTAPHIRVCKEQCFQIQKCEIYKGVEITDHCAVTSTDELEVAAPCSGPEFEKAGNVCGIQRCEKECKSRPTCHGFTVTSPVPDEEEYDTCWLDMGGEAGSSERYMDTALSKAYKKTCNSEPLKSEVCSDDVKLEWSQKFSPIAAGPNGEWDNECSDMEDTDERGICACLNKPEFNDVWSTEKHNCLNKDANMNLYKKYENCKPYRKYKKIGEGWCRPSVDECSNIREGLCRIPGIYADGEVHVKDGACEKWCNKEVKEGYNCIGYGIRREKSGRKKQRCILYGPDMTIGGSVRKAGHGRMTTLGQTDGTEGVACYKRVIPKQDRETELARMLNYLLEERLD